MRILDRVFLVGSGTLGFQISYPLDCNIYLIDAGNSYILVDAGCGIEPERIVMNIEREGISMKQISNILLTHAHADHAAGASFFHKRYGIEIICSAEAQPWLESADLEKTSLSAAITAGIYPEGFCFLPCPVTKSVTDGNVIQIGNLNIDVLETPGHARGHISFLIEEDGKRSLFAGDTIFSMGKVVVQNTWDCIISEYAETINRLNNLDIDRLYPGHGPFLLSKAYEHIKIADDYLKRLEFPPNL